MLEKIKQIKYSRLSEEEKFFLNTIDGIQPFKSDENSQSVLWKKNGTILLEEDYENGLLHVNYHLIWSVLGKKRNYSDTRLFITEIVDKHTNLKSLTPVHFFGGRVSTK